MGLEWVEVDAFHMPALPADLGIDPLLSALLHMACFMEFSGEKAVDFDESISTMEAMGYYFQRLSPKQIKEINTQLKRIVMHARKKKWKKEVIEFVSELLENSGVEQ